MRFKSGQIVRVKATGEWASVVMGIGTGRYLIVVGDRYLWKDEEDLERRTEGRPATGGPFPFLRQNSYMAAGVGGESDRSKAMDTATLAGAAKRGYDDGIKSGRSLQIEYFARFFLRDKCDEYVAGYTRGCVEEMGRRYRANGIEVATRIAKVVATRKD